MTRFWTDCWLGSGYLKDAYVQPIPSSMPGDRACDYWLSNWYLLALEEDSPKFELSISRKFISKEVYDLLPRDGLEEALLRKCGKSFFQDNVTNNFFSVDNMVHWIN
ncbi:hypothetical protein M9H77_19443 [Catharanthus roseus]|uniref:Uncharacterized protein n=1 Tax=Catharanthus roseus TaxID=4058 RepID=A0ACC0BAB3_CATRO|nr:hypothetical protein M9H77_19443 [Catharanthus roseus]